ncbi:hypothetical protein GALMADRAFT_53612 [Galerina marginata CBS 339.88]|uniref:Uncharacterized protein n=1 Tax=Galerina marginata (strain CBS 339.88) TaxID=685588 RepID=A0A067TZU5_GALM3|nr:hypothetical protein GALMADRAFT_53612 [Galerina marginata CBS 339.88]
MSSFRASPWVTYEPTASSHYRQQLVSEGEMDEDVDMDAPHISTLHEEETPPPQLQKKATTSHKKRTTVPPTIVEPWNHATANKQPDEIEDEEDQLIDDDDNDDVAKPSPSGRSTDNAQKRKASAKRKPRKGDKKVGEVEKKVKEKVSQPTGAHNLAPTMSCFKATPAESHEDTDIMNSSPMNPAGEPSAPKAKKKVSPRKPLPIPRAKAKLAKQKSAIPPLLLEDAGVLTESYAGTAASSPVTAQFEQNSPEPENIPPSSPPAVSAPLVDEPNLENVPIPVYPLPTKPFPVQPPQKIVSGFAPLLPLDKSNQKVRHWREANREIRGIAGGRWLARTWVGEKESDYASHVASVNPQAKPTDDKTSSSTVALPKLSSISISAPGPIKALGKLKGSSKAGSAVTSANPSRATSANPETQGIPITSTVRAPTKMRILQLAPSSEGGDSDMVPAPEA